MDVKAFWFQSPLMRIETNSSISEYVREKIWRKGTPINNIIFPALRQIAFEILWSAQSAGIIPNAKIVWVKDLSIINSYLKDKLKQERFMREWCISPLLIGDNLQI